jgi:cytochrome c biogenesis protein CcdA/thiol-disulfide isomerase/thioredoxin
VLQILLALGAGIATAASPCILPMLPLLLGASATRSNAMGADSHYRPLFIVLGFIVSFASTALLFGATTRVLGLSQQVLRNASIAVLLISGILLVSPTLLERAMAPFGRLADLAQRLGNRAGAGHAGGLLLGVSLGLLWTPCAGPVLASVLALIATDQQSQHAASMLVAYSVGAGLPMLAIAYGGRAVTARARGMARNTGAIRQIFGGMVIVTAAAMYFHVDVGAVAWLSRLFSGNSDQASAEIGKATIGDRAPEFSGIDNWFNSSPLTMAQLRGKVVLVDFWTYDCINCVNTLPHIKRWNELYKKQGLAVVGVHTPEFSFERETDNLRAAIARWGIEYPVAQDNGFRTWAAWHNEYWPAVYLVSREGRVVFKHVGEGDYARIEQQIQDALKEVPR